MLVLDMEILEHIQQVQKDLQEQFSLLSLSFWSPCDHLGSESAFDKTQNPFSHSPTYKFRLLENYQ